MISLIIRGCSSCLGKWKYIDLNMQYLLVCIFIQTCNKIKAYVINIHAKVSDIVLFVREAIVEGAHSAKDTYEKGVEVLQTKISCEEVLPT